MPFTREKQKHIACLDGRFRTMGTLEDPFTLRVIEQLVFVEYSSFLEIEIISVSMSLRGIVLTRGYLFIPYSTDGESP